MDDNLSNEEAKHVTKANEIIDKYVKDKVSEIESNAALIAALVGALLLVLLTYHADFSFLQKHMTVGLISAGVIGLFIGIMLGQRIIFFALGATVTYLIMQGS